MRQASSPLDVADMGAHTVRRVASFPCVSLATGAQRVPIDVHLVSRLGPGAGSQLFHEAQARQRHHDRFIDALDEPSAKLGGSDFARGDATALYSFGVGAAGHPFHCHAGHRIFTAVSGSAGTRLCFSTATPDELRQDPASFTRRLRHVDIPPDCLFTVRFPGGIWHRFVPRDARTRHPALFALSAHTDELGGDLEPALHASVLRDEGDIPGLTRTLPDAVLTHLASVMPARERIPTTTLSFDARPGGLAEAICAPLRSWAGHLRGGWARLRPRAGFVSEQAASARAPDPIVAAPRPSPQAIDSAARNAPAAAGGVPVQVHAGQTPADSLLHGALGDLPRHHQDHFVVTVPACDTRDAQAWLADLLDAFLTHRHPGVTRLMTLRNHLVRPWRLRTSPLACPVSSLLHEQPAHRFAERFPVHAWQADAHGRTAQVLLGADDRHLQFRTCVAVRLLEGDRLEFSLGTRVSCRNGFGRFYLRAIDAAHRRYVAPRVLGTALEGLMAQRIGR